MRTVVSRLISFYKIIITPVLVRMFGNGCRYYPTCADYSRQAIETHGLYRGFLMSAKRIGKCHPFAHVETAFDPVPSKTVN